MASTGEHIAFDRMLVVEDDERTQRRLVQLLLELTDSIDNIAVADGVASAKTLISASAPTLALVDIGLPDGNGLELISWIGQHHASVVTVAISAWGHEEVVLVALRSGAVGYLMKERDNAELIAALQSIRRGGALIDPLIARRILDFVQLVPTAQRVRPLKGTSINCPLLV